MIVKVFTDINDLDITRQEWDALVYENETNTIFQTYDWFKCWWAIFGEDNLLFFICVYDNNNNLSGFAPLTINNNVYGKRTLMFVGDGNADYLDFIIPRNKENILNAIFNNIKKNKQHWKNITLRNIPEFSTTTGLLKALPSNIGVHCTIAKKNSCPTLLVKNRINQATEIANKYSTKRSFNYFKRTGNLSHIIIKNNTAVDSYLDSFFNQHIARWQNTKTPSLFLNDKNKRFYKLLAKTLIPKEFLLFSMVTHNNTPITYHFGFDYNSVVTWYKSSFAVELSNHSPGILMIRYLIIYCMNNNKQELDFTVGNEPYKARFTNLTRFNNNLRAFTNIANCYLFNASKLLKEVIKFLINK